MMEQLKKDIIALLGEDARYDAARLAEMTGSTAEEAAAVVSELEQAGVIVKYSAVINSEKIGDEVVNAFIEVKTTPQKDKGFDAIAADICRYPEVKSVYLMSGAYDLAVIIEGKRMRDISNFVYEKLAVMDAVTSTATHFILRAYKLDGVVFDGDRGEKRLPVQA